MFCPDCKTKLEKQIFYNVEIDYCPDCLGLFFEKEELRIAKDEKDKNLSWLDIDLWGDKKKFNVSKHSNLCPLCQLPMYVIEYGDSGIKIDICNVCQGVWLDRGEFKKLVQYLKEHSKSELLKDYIGSLKKEMHEVLVGPETLREEVIDTIAVLKLLKYKLLVQYPLLNKIISGLPK